MCYNEYANRTGKSTKEEKTMREYWEISCEEIGTDYESLMAELMNDPEYIKMMEEKLGE
jgi:hypothetical protein